jgi:hypothetical protein
MDDDAMATVVSFVAAGILFVSCCSAVLLSATGIEHLSTAMDPGHALAAHTVFDNFVRGSLMKAQGVLDGTTVASLLPGDSMVVDPNDGRMSYGEARALLGVPANQHFNLLVINADGSRIEFGAPLPEHTPLDGASGMFCLDLCPSAGGSVATVRLFFFDGDAATATTSTSSAPPTTPPPTQANLLIAALAQSPLAPRVGDATAFTATVSNLGLAATPAVPLVVRFLVDGTSLGTSQATGPLAVGASVQVVSPTWTAAGIGAHTLTATVDPFGAVGESSEADNDATLSFAVAAGVQTLIGAADPGYAFVDTNRDNLFTTGTDTPIAAASIPGAGHNLCSYDAGAQGLVIPASVGPIAAASCSLKATKNLLVGVNLTATGTLDVAAGDITVQPGKVFDAKGALTMLPDTSFVGSGSTFRSAAALRIGSGSPGQLDSSITLVGATLDTTAGSGSLTVAWQNGDLGATNAKLLSKGAINLGGANKGHQAGNAVLSGATVDNTAGSGALAVQYVSGAITATGSSTAFRWP